LTKQDYAERTEAEMYYYNNAERLIARIKDDSHKAIAQKAEDAKEAFQNRHARCEYCTGVPTSSFVCVIPRSGSSSQVAYNEWSTWPLVTLD